MENYKIQTDFNDRVAEMATSYGQKNNLSAFIGNKKNQTYVETEQNKSDSLVNKFQKNKKESFKENAKKRKSAFFNSLVE